MSRFRIAMDSNLDDLFLVSLLIRAVCSHLELDPAGAAELELCAVEAVTNAIKHGYGRQPGHEVGLALSFDEQRVDLDVCDHGSSMPQAIREQLRRGSNVFAFDASDLVRVPEGGMGLEIIRQTMDEAEYFSDGSTNRLRMTKFLRKGAAI